MKQKIINSIDKVLNLIELKGYCSFTKKQNKEKEEAAVFEFHYFYSL
jgi:hypothetical protein